MRYSLDAKVDRAAAGARRCAVLLGSNIRRNDSLKLLPLPAVTDVDGSQGAERLGGVDRNKKTPSQKLDPSHFCPGDAAWFSANDSLSDSQRPELKHDRCE